MKTNQTNEQEQNKRLLGNKPTFYLVYLVFYFVPWLFLAPTAVDIAVALLVLALFVPIHYWSFRAKDRYKPVTIILIELFAVVSAPFHLGFGVFHIYAAAQAGFVPKLKLSASLLTLCCLIFVGSGYAFQRSWIEMGFGLVMAMFVWISCLTEFEKDKKQRVLIRERELDRQQASLNERERIAGDLHDLLGHTLTMVALKSEIASKLMDKDPERAKQEIREINQESRSALKNVRAAVSGITSTTLVQEIENARTALEAAKVQFEVKGVIPTLNIEQDKAASLAVREAVTNVVRHSDATHVKLTFSCDKTSHFVVFEDNGSNANGKEGSGLIGLKRRFENIGGKAVVHMLNGVKIEAQLPVI